MFKLLKNFNKKDYFFVLLILVCIMGQVWFDLRLPDYMSKITVLVQTEGSKMNDILLNGGYMLLCALGSLILSIGVGYIIANLGANFSYV